MLVEIIARDDGGGPETRFVEDAARLDAEIGEVAGIEAHADHFHSLFSEAAADLHRVAHTLERVVGVHQEHAVVGHYPRVCAEGLALVVEGHHPAMGMSPAQGDSEELAGEDVGGRGTSPDVGGAARGERAVDALGAAQSELQYRIPIRGGTDSGRFRGHQGLKVDHVEQRSLQQLTLQERAGYPEHRLVRKDHGALGHGVDVESEVQFAEMREETLVEECLPVIAGEGGEEGEVVVFEAQVAEEVQHVGEACRHRISAAEGVGAEKEMERRLFPHPAEFPVPVGHRELVEVSQQRQRMPVDAVDAHQESVGSGLSGRHAHSAEISVAKERRDAGVEVVESRVDFLSVQRDFVFAVCAVGARAAGHEFSP